MRYSKSELLELANEVGQELYVLPITESVFESWISKRLLQKAEPYGKRRGVNPTWLFPVGSDERVRQIVSLRSMGGKRSAQLGICLWVLSGGFSFGKVHKNLKSEFRRIIKKQLRGPQWWQGHYDDLDCLPDALRERRKAKLPPLDQDLESANLSLPLDVIFDISLRAYWGEQIGNIPSVLAKALALQFQLPEELTVAVLDFLDISGAIGSPDEGEDGGYEQIDHITEGDLETARNLVLLIFLGLWVGERILTDVLASGNSPLVIAFQKALRSWVTPEWMITSLSLFAISASRMRRGTAKNLAT